MFSSNYQDIWDYNIVPFFFHILIYWSASFIFYILDCIYMDKKHKNWTIYPSVAKQCLINQITITLPTLYLFTNIIKKTVMDCIDDSYFISIIKLFIIRTVFNILFYSFHRLLHIKILFDNIHYKHHELSDPIAVGGLYSTPVEHFIINTLTLFLPFILIGINYTFMNIYFGIATFVVVATHSKNKKIMSNDHILHHNLNKYNYGFGSLLDNLLGTYKQAI